MSYQKFIEDLVKDMGLDEGDTRVSPDDVLTTERIQAAEKVLRDNNVPPWKCPSCGHTFYVVLGPGTPGPPWNVSCVCGVVTKIGRSQ